MLEQHLDHQHNDQPKSHSILKFFKSGYIKSLFFGMLLTLAFAPFYQIYLIPVSFTLFLGLLGRCPTLKAAIYCGFLYGFGYFGTSLYSFSNALFFQDNKFIWMIPLAVILLPTVLSLLFVVPVASVAFYMESNFIRALVFGNMWFMSEYLRANFIWPFPWNMLGYSLVANDMLLQNAFTMGLYGATYIIAVISSIPHTRSKIAILLAMFQVGAMFYYGYKRLENNIVEYHDNIKIRVLQPNLPHHFGQPDLQKANMEKLGIYSMFKRDESLTHIIWPEASYPYLLQSDDSTDRVLKGLAPVNGALIFGADRKAIGAGGVRSYYNSVIAIDSELKLLGVYDKEKLVPFGEYVPLRRLLPFISKVAYGMQDFTPGYNIYRSMSLPNFPVFIPLICYEIIFPDLIIGEKRPDFLLNFSNESWFGDSLAPDHLFAMARFRAAEYGLPVVRASNHGNSAVIDPFGIVVEERPIGYAGFIESKLPKRLDF